jgi:hypothetical protein
LAQDSTGTATKTQQAELHLSATERGVTKDDGESIHVWSSQDALVLKMLAMALADALALSPHCTHIKGHGG